MPESEHPEIPQQLLCSAAEAIASGNSDCIELTEEEQCPRPKKIKVRVQSCRDLGKHFFTPLASNSCICRDFKDEPSPFQGVTGVSIPPRAFHSLVGLLYTGLLQTGPLVWVSSPVFCHLLQAAAVGAGIVWCGILAFTRGCRDEPEHPNHLLNTCP